VVVFGLRSVSHDTHKKEIRRQNQSARTLHGKPHVLFVGCTVDERRSDLRDGAHVPSPSSILSDIFLVTRVRFHDPLE
jgi:hypothetical protein